MISKKMRISRLLEVDPVRVPGFPAMAPSDCRPLFAKALGVHIAKHEVTAPLTDLNLIL